jgi:acyl-CoA reductase-like NAD-dependent aldehyde dehydrogenase
MVNGGHPQIKGTYEVINPATEEVLGQASKATHKMLVRL